MMHTSEVEKSDLLDFHGADRNMLMFHLPGMKRVLTTPQPRPQLSDLPSEKVADEQFQSPFFQTLPQEIRDEICALALTSRENEDEYYHDVRCECLHCELRRDDDDRRQLSHKRRAGKLDGPRKLLTHDVMPLFSVCRRLYDEARPILQQVNECWFDGKANIAVLLKKITTGLSLHRGLLLPASVLVSGTFCFNLLPDDSGCDGQKSFTRFHRAVSQAQYRSAGLEIRHLTIIIGIAGPHIIAEFVPLLRTLEKLRGVQKCDIIVKYSNAITTAVKFDTDITESISRDLEHAALNPMPKIHNRASINDFAEARQLIQSHSWGSGIFLNLTTIEVMRADRWDWGLDEKQAPASLAEEFGLGDFLAATAASADTGLDPRAKIFWSGVKEHKMKEMSVY